MKQEELSKNEQMTRKRMVSNMRALHVKWMDLMHHNLYVVKGG